jgi:hypothetical protein
MNNALLQSLRLVLHDAMFIFVYTEIYKVCDVDKKFQKNFIKVCCVKKFIEVTCRQKVAEKFVGVRRRQKSIEIRCRQKVAEKFIEVRRLQKNLLKSNVDKKLK